MQFAIARLIIRVFLLMSARMFIVDDSAIYFEIPARDPLGKEAVQGKLRGTQERVFFHWRMKDRTFRRSAEDMKTVEIPYAAVESVEYKATLGFMNPRLIFHVTDPKYLSEVPGVDVGRAELRLDKRSKSLAKKFMKLVEYKKAEEEAAISRRRLNNLDDAPPGGPNA